jgi:hypothetical protein
MRSSNEPTRARPCADHGANRPVADAVRQVGTDSGHDADPQAPRGQAWYAVVPAACVEYHHGRGPDEAVDRERQKAGGQPGLAVRGY